MDSEYIQAIEGQSKFVVEHLDEIGFIGGCSLRETDPNEFDDHLHAFWMMVGKPGHGVASATVTFFSDGSFEEEYKLDGVSEADADRIREIFKEYCQRVLIIFQVGEYYEVDKWAFISRIMSGEVKKELDKKILEAMMANINVDDLREISGDISKEILSSIVSGRKINA